jgi:hypothetical protein
MLSAKYYLTSVNDFSLQRAILAMLRLKRLAFNWPGHGEVHYFSFLQLIIIFNESAKSHDYISAFLD